MYIFERLNVNKGYLCIYLIADSNLFLYICLVLLILWLMKQLFFAFLVCCTLSSCYAFLKADKLVYAGTVAKKPVQVKVDTSFNTSVVVDDVQFSE